MQPTHTQVAEPATDPVTAQTVTPARALRAAALHLTRHGWVQGSYYDQTAAVFTPAACVVGAIGMVCYGGPVEAPAQHFDQPGWAEFEAAVTHLDRFVSAWHGADSAYGFNDEPGRNAQEVLDVLAEAADVWELLHVSCPVCGEPVYSRPPTDWHMPESWPVPAYSHRDGTPLCPVSGSDGVTPALPVLAGGA